MSAKPHYSAHPRDLTLREMEIHQWGDTHFIQVKKAYKLFIFIQLAAAVLAFATLFAADATLSAVLGLLTFGCQIIAWIFQSQSPTS